MLTLLVLLSTPISSCDVAAPVNPLVAIAEVPVCGPAKTGGLYDVIDLDAELNETPSGHGPIELVVNRPSGQLPDGFTGNWPAPKTTIDFYDEHPRTSLDPAPINGRATVKDDGSFEIWTPAYRNGGYQERSVLITGHMGPGNAITIDEYRYIDDFVHTSSLDTSKVKSRREYKKGPITICLD